MRIGDLYKVITFEGTFYPGSIIRVIEMDGTDIPFFDLVIGMIRPGMECRNKKGNPTASYAHISNLERLETIDIHITVPRELKAELVKEAYRRNIKFADFVIKTLNKEVGK